MKRLTKQKKGFKRIGRVNVKAAGIALAALMGAGSATGAVGAVNVFASEEATVKAVSQEESVNAAESLTGSEETRNAVNAESDASGAEAKETTKDIIVDTEEKTDESSVQNENTTPSYTTIVENNKDIRLENITEDKKSSGVGAVNAVEAVKNGWVKESGGYKYFKNGKAYTGWHKMGKAEGEKTEHWSYFGKNGIVYTGWKKMGKAEGEKTAHWSYFGSNGWLRTGWVQLGKGTSEPDGNVAKHWSYFGSNGWLRTGWVQLGKGTANPDGNVAKHWSYFGSNGWLRTGWVQLGKGTSEPDGNVAKHWSYFGSNGWLRTGWVQFGKGTSEPDGNAAKHWSFFEDNGWLRTGLQDMGKGTNNPDGNAEIHKSYFGDNGWLVVNKQFAVGDTTYKADGRGWLTTVNTNTQKRITVTFTDGFGKVLAKKTGVIDKEGYNNITPPDYGELYEGYKVGSDWYILMGWDKTWYNATSDITVNCEWKRVDFDTICKDVFNLINNEREKVGAPKLIWNDKMAQAAQSKAIYMSESGIMNHDNDTEIFSQVVGHGLRCNLFWLGFRNWNSISANATVEWWMNSPGHREQMLRETYRYCGIGWFKGNYVATFWYSRV